MRRVWALSTNKPHAATQARKHAKAKARNHASTKARTKARTYFRKKLFFETTTNKLNPSKKGVGKNTRAFCLGRTESIPAVKTLQ